MTKARLLLATIGLVVLSLIGTTGTASAVTSGDPLGTGCANGAQTIWKMTYLGAGTVEVR